MKIGEFANKNNVSIDTIRHYMDLNLIIPEKQGGYYWFDENCQKNLDEILDLKGLGFTLNEVKTILLFQTLANLTPYQQDEYYRTLFINKHKNIINEVENLTCASEKLSLRIKEMSNYESKKKFTLGLDISTLHIFSCLKCGGRLSVENAVITDNQIIDGKLKCCCGEVCEIKNGIVVVGDINDIDSLVFEEEYVANYIDSTDYMYLDNIYKSIDYFKKRINSDMLHGKVILELGSGSGFSLRNFMKKLPEDCIYIAVDHDIKRHEFLKSMLERADIKRNVIFMCSDFLNTPIKNNCVDYLFDFWGTSNYGFEHEKFLLGKIQKYVNKNTRLLGSYIAFKNFEENSKIPDIYKKNFRIKNIRANIINAGFEIEEESFSDYLEHGGKYEDYFVEGEKVFAFKLTANRSG